MWSKQTIVRSVPLVLMLVGLVWGRPSGHVRTIILRVDVPRLAWSGSTLEAKLVRHLSRNVKLNVVTSSNNAASHLETPLDWHNADSLKSWGQEVGGHYLLTVEVHNEWLETTKSFHLPLVFHKYETSGVIEGELLLIDLTRGKQLGKEPFTVRQKGPRIFQATMDDDINDPDLHLTAFDKIRFFDHLEEKTTNYVVNWVGKLIRLR
ncbi:MAG: hypothetical protein ACE5K8_01180 [Candidatus Zixiibacteriota bacterium]